MSRGKKLQEMEVDVQENAVTAGAAKGDPKPEPGSNAAGVSTPGNDGSWEDLGGPTPENYKTDDDSAKLKVPGATLKQVKDVVNKGAKPAEGSKKLKSGAVKEESEAEEEVIQEDEVKDSAEETISEEDKVSEETESKEEVVAEETAEEEVKEEINVEEDVAALLQGEELSEEFQAKAKTIFEAAIGSKVAAIKEELEADHAKKVEEATEALRGEITERVDGYLEYVSQEWLEENQLAVDQGLKAELSESFMTGMKSLFEEHYVSIPEEKYDVLESMVNKLDEMESKLNEQLEKNVALNRRLAESTSDGILSEISEGLAVTQKEKLASLAESVEFESENDYREKLVALKESYFPTNAPSAQRDTSENLTEGAEPAAQDYTGSMANYLSTLQRVAKK